MAEANPTPYHGVLGDHPSSDAHPGAQLRRIGLVQEVAGGQPGSGFRVRESRASNADQRLRPSARRAAARRACVPAACPRASLPPGSRGRSCRSRRCRSPPSAAARSCSGNPSCGSRRRRRRGPAVRGRRCSRAGFLSASVMASPQVGFAGQAIALRAPAKSPPARFTPPLGQDRFERVAIVRRRTAAGPVGVKRTERFELLHGLQHGLARRSGPCGRSRSKCRSSRHRRAARASRGATAWAAAASGSSASSSMLEAISESLLDRFDPQPADRVLPAGLAAILAFALARAGG